MEDTGPPPRVDTDGDGVCDDTELVWGTDLMAPDTDGDGFTDGIERQFGYQPWAADSPARESLVFLSETEAASTTLAVTRIVRGEGETFSGAFSSEPVMDRLGLDARSFFDRALAVGAEPEENVFEVREDEERFVGVVGRTQLFYEVRFAFGANVPRSCARGYPFRYEIRRDDGINVLVARYLLVVLPPGQRLDTTEWCALEGPCI